MGLAPLEDIQFSSNSRPWTDEINDAAVAFSHTLKRLRAATWSMDSEFLPVMHHIGMNWVNLPLLTCLHISIDRDRLVIDQELLMHCPNLVSLYLHDETLEYQCEDIQQSYLPAILPCLESLELKGWPALTFHPVTLHSTPSLKELSITCARYMVDEGRYSTAGPEEDDFIDFNCYIPPIAELYDSYGIPRSSSAFDIYDIPKIPSLTKLRMHGPCLFDRSCSDDDQFPARIFPNLESLSAFEWDDFPLDYFTNLVKTMPSQSLKEVFLNSWLFVEVRKEKELKLMMKEDVEKYNKEDVLAAVSIGIVLYDLLR
ncbi:hypothetical protein BGX24_010173 [Mortierella sp. AD032]|nr:hypothetical protein BGX24_010173 [Mortierella sp. AD032]